MIWVAAIAGLFFFVVHAIYVRYIAQEAGFTSGVSPELAARLFHWVMAASMFTLLFTAILPKVGIRFNWVTCHWIAGTVLTISIVFHVIHASFRL